MLLLRVRVAIRLPCRLVGRRGHDHDDRLAAGDRRPLRLAHLRRVAAGAAVAACRDRRRPRARAARRRPSPPHSDVRPGADPEAIVARAAVDAVGAGAAVQLVGRRGRREPRRRPSRPRRRRRRRRSGGGRCRRRRRSCRCRCRPARRRRRRRPARGRSRRARSRSRSRANARITSAFIVPRSRSSPGVPSMIAASAPVARTSVAATASNPRALPSCLPLPSLDVPIQRLPAELPV